VFWVWLAMMAQTQTAVIVNSGSTNTRAYRIVVQPSGQAEYSGAKTQTSQLPADLAKRFYADLEAARPLGSLAKPHCMKSASFGTVTKVQYQGEETPDLSCGDGGDAKLGALVKDVGEIGKYFGK
jgi:hypothetical protein